MGRAALGAIVACAAQFLVGADGLAVAIALPALRDDLGAATVDAQWVLTAYGLAFGGTLLLGGRLGDLYGRRRMATLGVAANAVAFTAIVYLGTLYLQDALGYGPLTASFALAPIDAVALVVTLALARRLARPEILPAMFAVSAFA